MLRTLLAAALLFAFSSAASAQASFAWNSTHSGNANQMDDTSASCVAAFPTGGVVAAYSVRHFTQSYPNSFYTPIAVDVVRWSATGQKLWTVRLFAAFTAKAIAVGPNGEIYVGTSGTDPFQVYRVAADGNVEWGTGLSGQGSLERMILGADGNVVVAGRLGTSSQMRLFVASFSADGASQWEETITFQPGNAWDDVDWIGQDSQGNYLVTGAFYAQPELRNTAVKLDANGQVLWTRHLLSSSESLFGAIAPGDDLVVSATRYVGPGSPTEAYLARLDPDGATLWETGWGTLDADVSVRDVAVGPDGTAWTIGHQGDESVLPHTWHLQVRRHDASGAFLSEDVYDAEADDGAFPIALVDGGAGQFYATASILIGLSSGTGHTVSVAIQYDTLGQRNWVLALDGFAGAQQELMQSVVLTAERQLVFGGAFCSLGNCHGKPGVLIAYDLAESPKPYCEGKANSAGCTPRTDFAGLSSASATSGFAVGASGVLENKIGMMLYSVTGPNAAAFQGGTLCVLGPILRTPVVLSGGDPTGGETCSGAYAIDMNEFAHGLGGGSPHPSLLVPGTSVWCQAWGRDPGFAPPNNTSLSNGISYVVLP